MNNLNISLFYRVMKLFFLLGFILSTLVSCSFNQEFLSPNGKIKAIITQENGNLMLTIKNNGLEVLKPSLIGVEIDRELMKWEIKGVETTDGHDVFSLPAGEYSHINIPFKETKLYIFSNEYSGSLYIRVYNNAVAYKLNFNTVSEKPYTLSDISEFIVADPEAKFSIPNGEAEPIGPQLSKDFNDETLYTPLVCQAFGYALAIHEAAGFDFPTMLIKKIDKLSAFAISIEDVLREKKANMPWRTIFIADKIHNLYDSKKIQYGLNPPAKGDYSWIKPGISVWDWRVNGAKYGDFTYRPDTESMLRQIDFAANMKIPYFLLDFFWSKNDTGYPLEANDNIDIKKVMSYAVEKNVDIWLYYDPVYVDRGYDEIDFDTVARTLSEMGAKGIKYGFLGEKGPIYRGLAKTQKTIEKIEIAAKYRLMIIFEDWPLPFSGIERTYPNYMNREYCHQQMDGRTAFEPISFIKMSMINLLAGSIDQTNCVYGLTDIMQRERGPRNPLNSTVACENARFLITHTGYFSVLPDTPEEYKKKADLFNFIVKMPARWDDTKILDGEYPRFLTMARRSGNKWFVGSVFNEEGGIQELKLDFLDKNKTYNATIMKDAVDTDYMENRERYVIEIKQVISSDVLNIHAVAGGGFSILFE